MNVDRALSLRSVGDLRAAINAAQQALVQQPDDVAVIQLIGILFCESEVFDKGINFLKIAGRLDPKDVQTWLNAALAFRRLGHHGLALDAAKVVIVISPENSLMMLAVTRYVANKELRLPANDRRITFCMWALKVEPSSFEVACHLGMIFKRSDCPNEALQFFRRAFVLSPDTVVVLIGLADTLADLGAFESAKDVYQTALQLDQTNHNVRYHLSLVQLRLGLMGVGWRNYESRWFAAVGASHLRESAAVRSTRPVFGSSGRTKRVLVWAEQGIGDEIMFGSLLSEFLSHCDKLLVQLDPRLVPLFARSYPEIQFFGYDEVVPLDLYDEQIPIGSLGSLLRPTRPSFAGKGCRFLSAKKGAGERIRGNLGINAGEFLVGLSWRAANPENQKIRSITLQALQYSLAFPRVRFLNLQYGNVNKDLSAITQPSYSKLLVYPGVDLTNDIDGVAGLIEACDLVVSVGNAVAHLAGALGRPTWVLLPKVSGWRWLHGSSTCDWYTSVRLFRQENRGQWSDVLSALRNAMEQSVLS